MMKRFRLIRLSRRKPFASAAGALAITFLMMIALAGCMKVLIPFAGADGWLLMVLTSPVWTLLVIRMWFAGRVFAEEVSVFLGMYSEKDVEDRPVRKELDRYFED